MTWLSIAAGLVKLVTAIIGYLDKKQLIDAGMAKAALANLRKSNAAIDDALKAARAVRRNPNSDYARRLRDKYTVR